MLYLKALHCLLHTGQQKLTHIPVIFPTSEVRKHNRKLEACIDIQRVDRVGINRHSNLYYWALMKVFRDNTAKDAKGQVVGSHP